MTAMGQVIEFSRQEVSISAGHAESMPTSQHFFTGKKRAQKSAVTPVIRGLNQIKLLVSCRLLWSDPWSAKGPNTLLRSAEIRVRAQVQCGKPRHTYENGP